MNNLTTLYAYYESAYAAVRSVSADCFVLISPRTWEQDSAPSHSATPAGWQTLMSGPPYTKVLLDLHKCAVRSRTVNSQALPSPACLPAYR